MMKCVNKCLSTITTNSVVCVFVQALFENEKKWYPIFLPFKLSCRRVVFCLSDSAMYFAPLLPMLFSMIFGSGNFFFYKKKN